MSGQHTPGPWMAASHPSSKVGLPIVSQPGGRSIASVTFFHLGEAFANHDRESQANARLIAAAPELLEALVDCAESLSGAGCDPVEHGSNPCDASLFRALAAIAKARNPSNG